MAELTSFLLGTRVPVRVHTTVYADSLNCAIYSTTRSAKMAALTKGKNKSFGDTYTVPSSMVKEFSPSEIGELKQHFRAYDADGNGSIDADELRTVVNNLGENISRVKLMR